MWNLATVQSIMSKHDEQVLDTKEAVSAGNATTTPLPKSLGIGFLRPYKCRIRGESLAQKANN